MPQQVTWWRPKPQNQALLAGHRLQLGQLDSAQGLKGWAQWRSSLVTHGRDLARELSHLQEVALGAKGRESPSGTGGKHLGWLRSLLNSLKLAGRRATRSRRWSTTRLGSQADHLASPTWSQTQCWPLTFARQCISLGQRRRNIWRWKVSWTKL